MSTPDERIPKDDIEALLNDSEMSNTSFKRTNYRDFREVFTEDGNWSGYFGGRIRKQFHGRWHVEGNSVCVVVDQETKRCREIIRTDDHDVFLIDPFEESHIGGKVRVLVNKRKS